MPALPALDAAQTARLHAGQVVVVADISPEHTAGTGFVRANAPASKLWAAVLDIPARKAENPSLADVSVYDRAGDTFGVRFELAMFGIRAVTHERWSCQPAEMTCRYTLDVSKPNDVDMDEGEWRVSPDATGSIVTFFSTYHSEMWTPGWVRRWLATDSMETVLSGIARRAER